MRDAMKYPLLLVCLAILGAGTAQAQCLKPMPGQRAEGRLTIGRFSDAAGRRETAYILRLVKRACLDDAEDSEARKGTRRIHVFSPDDATARKMRRLVGRKVVVIGEPFGQHTAHHHAPIVMTVSDIGRR